ARRLATMPERVIVIDAIGLLESPLVAYCRRVWVVTAPPEQQVTRLVATRGYTADEAWLRVRAQRPQAEKVARADLVFDNSGTREELLAQVEDAWAALRAEIPHRGRPMVERPAAAPPPLILAGRKIVLRDWQLADLDSYAGWIAPGHRWQELDAPYYPG